MALSIVNNPTAIGAQGGVNSVNSALAKTIKSLSTGLRINSAADDASGLAVSEKLRAQISGLNKAATNAQDAISMLQTAEGAMGSMTSMVQRIRELAVQAGDPAYTSNDRAMLQLEVDQLKEEIDSVSTSTEFNTKKLLNGDAAALWSASTDNIEAIIKGAAAEGNYKISYDVDPGRNSVYKSNIMRLGEGEMSYDINSNSTGIKKLDNITGMMREDNLDITVGKVDVVANDGTSAAGATVYSPITTFSGSATDTYFGNNNGLEAYSIAAQSATLTINGNKILTATGTYNLSVNGVDYTLSFATANNTVTFTAPSGSNVYSADTAAGGTTITANSLVQAGPTSANVSAFTGNNNGIVSSAGLTNMKKVGGSFIEMEVVTDAFNNGEAQGFQVKMRTRDAATGNISEWMDIAINSAGQTIGNTTLFSAGVTLFNNMTTDSGQLKKGDKILAQASNGSLFTGSQALNATSSAFGTVKIGNGATVTMPNLTNYDTPSKHTLYTAQMDKAGNVYFGQMELTFEKGDVITGTASVDILGEGDVASPYTKLSQLAQFTNSDGRMILDNTQEITIYAGNGKTAKVTLEGSDTIADLEDKLTAALVDQLNMGADSTNTAATTVNDNLVKFVETPTGGDHAVAGTFVIQSAILGDKSNLTFVGDEAVLSALGITQIQEAQDSALNVRVTDAHTGAFIGEDTVTDNRLRNVIEGVDVIINPESAANVTFENGKMVFQDKLGAEVAFLHIKDNATKAAVGANEGQVIDISIGRLDTVGMGIDGINVATFNDAQKAITKLDMALEQISAARATAGAQMNRLEYTITNLNTTRENMVSAESRIRDLDIAQASTDLAAQQVLLQSATAMLAQANQIPSYAAQLLQ